MAPKIKIVDVSDKNDEYAVTVDEVKESELPAENTTSETTEETTAIIQKKDENEGEEVSKDTTTTELRGVRDTTNGIVKDDPSPTKKIREQQLVKCEKCGKFVTPKTLKYTHSLKCGVEKYQPGRPKKSKINENVKEEAPPPPPPTEPPPPPPAPVQKVVKDKPPPVLKQDVKPPIVKEVVKSFEEMRKERLEERLKQREERNINLFKQVL